MDRHFRNKTIIIMNCLQSFQERDDRFGCLIFVMHELCTLEFCTVCSAQLSPFHMESYSRNKSVWSLIIYSRFKHTSVSVN